MTAAIIITSLFGSAIFIGFIVIAYYLDDGDR